MTALPSSSKFAVRQKGTPSPPIDCTEPDGQLSWGVADVTGTPSPAASAASSTALRAASMEPLPPLVIPADGLDAVDKWILQTYATVEKRCRRQGPHNGVTYFEESWL